MKKFRWLQLITGIHYIHDVYWSFGFKIPFTKYGYFKDYGFRKTCYMNINNEKVLSYHNCTLTNRY